LAAYLLGIIGVLALGARLAASWGQPSLRTAAGRRAATLTLAFAFAALATLARVPPISALLNAVLYPDSAWLIADTLWLLAGFLGLLWVDPVMQPARAEAPEWDPLHALWQARTSLIALVAAGLWAAAWQHPQAWHALEHDTPASAGFGLLPLVHLVYQSYLFLLLVYFEHCVWRLRTVAEDRAGYLRLSTGLLAGGVYMVSPAVQVIMLVAAWRMPETAVWLLLFPIAQIAQIAGCLLVLPVIAPPRLAEKLFTPLLPRERRQARAQLEQFHTWLEARQPKLALPLPDGPERNDDLLAEIERAARYALAYAPAGTRTRLAELGENRIYIAGYYGLRAEPAAALIAQALRDWPSERMPAELPRFRFVGDSDARLIFWGWVAGAAVMLRVER
jgi:hypothetical protein